VATFANTVDIETVRAASFEERSSISIRKKEKADHRSVKRSVSLYLEEANGI